jgi:very-short-patch-repair endonuclease
MGSLSRQKASAAWELARRQHGVIGTRQLQRLGLSPQAIGHRAARGRLHRVERGVYALGRPELTQRGRWMAAVLGGGAGAVLSHGSAAALWGIAETAGPPEITVPVSNGRKRDGVVVHRRPGLRGEAAVERHRIPVTSLVRTMIDIARFLDRPRMERAIGEADRLNLIDPEALLSALNGYPGQRGVGSLRDILGSWFFRLTDSELERRFLRLVQRARLKPPLTRQRVNGFRVDFYWPDLGLVVETDGLRYHRTPLQQTRDRRRDQAHTAAGLIQLRFSHTQVCSEPDEVVKVLRLTSERLRVEAALATRREAPRLRQGARGKAGTEP